VQFPTEIALTMVVVFLFGAVAWVRPDGRTRCWFAGWLFLLGSYVASYGRLHAGGGQSLAWTAASANLAAMAGMFFAVSAAAPLRGWRFGVFMWTSVTIPTVFCLTLTTLTVGGPWILTTGILARLAPGVTMSLTSHRRSPRLSRVPLVSCAISGCLMVYLLFHGGAKWIVPVMLAEIYIVAGLGLWARRLVSTIGMRAAVIGLLAWAMSYPLAPIVQSIWPQIGADSAIWELPQICVAAGMMLMVFEEEALTVRALARDYGLAFNCNPNPLLIFEVETLQFLAVNEAAAQLHGYTTEEFLKLKLPDILHPEVRERAIRATQMPKRLSNQASRHIRKDGTEFPVDITTHAIVFQGKECHFVLCIDVTKQVHLERRLEYQSDHDALTGLANRRAFEERLSEAVDRTMKTGKKLVVLCLDLYHFKRLNDVYGPRIGDQCVQYIASALNSHVRTIDFVARTGDDEFAVVLTGLRDLSPAKELTGWLNEHFKTPIFIDHFEIQLPFSLGLAVCPDDSTQPMALWHLAESALRTAQASGSGEAIWFSPELREEAERRLEIAASMTKMMEEDRFHLVYQPLYGEDGTVRGLEALLRLNHPRYGAIPPPIVIQIAEETGLMEQLGHWVIDRACRQMRTWMDGGVRLVPVAINISPMQLMRKGFAENLAEILVHHCIDPRWIHLEITETAVMNNLREVSGEMSILSALGSRVSIDDFGTGHSSLGRLHQLPISILKIDRSFIEHLDSSNAAGRGASCTIVQAILSMAHTLALQVVAEGVETEQQLNCLRRLGCDFYQGFLLARPAPPEEIPSLITKTHPAFAAAPMEKSSLADSESLEKSRSGSESQALP